MDDKFLSLIQCSISEDKHILQQGISLSCGDFICQKCVPANKSVQCLKCKSVNQFDLSIAKESEMAKYLVESNLSNLIKITKENIQIEEEKRQSRIKHS